jgi:hypothetical protein
MESQRQVELDIEKAEEVLTETLARLARLRRQKRVLRERGTELFSRGVREVDEVDGVRSQEEAILAEQQAIGDAQASGAVDMLDWSSILGSDLDPSLFSSGVVAESPSGGVAHG